MPTIREWQFGVGGVASRSSTGRRVQLASVASPLRRRISAVLGVGLFMRLLPAAAEETRVARVGVIIQRSIVPGGPAGPLTRALRDLGWVEGRNIAFDRRGVNGDNSAFPALVAELVALRPDVIAVETTPGALAAKAATSTIPIVFWNVTDPVATGLVSSLGKPAGNITGVADLGVEMVVKNLELARKLMPRATRIAVLMSQNPVHQLQLEALRKTAVTMRLTVVPTAVVSADDLEAAFRSMREIDAVITLGGPPFGGEQCGRMVDRQNRTSIPLLGLCTGSGGLASYVPDSQEMTRQTAIYVDKILRGGRPSDLPVQQPTQFDLKLNASTARRFGLAIPSEVLLRAQQVLN